MNFLDDKWGDLVGLLLVFLGVGLTLESVQPPVQNLGQGLVMTGVGLLKLQRRSSSNSSGGQGA